MILNTISTKSLDKVCQTSARIFSLSPTHMYVLAWIYPAEKCYFFIKMKNYFVNKLYFTQFYIWIDIEIVMCTIQFINNGISTIPFINNIISKVCIKNLWNSLAYRTTHVSKRHFIQNGIIYTNSKWITAKNRKLYIKTLK